MKLEADRPRRVIPRGYVELPPRGVCRSPWQSYGFSVVISNRDDWSHGAPRVADASDPDLSVLIADDEGLVRAGFRAILESEPGIVVCGEAIDGANAVDLARRRRPDVVLMDVQMPGMDGLEAARRILAGGEGTPAVLMLTTFDRNEYVYEALRAGASGFLLKDVPPEQLLAAIRIVASGEALIAPTITKRLIEQFARTAPPFGGAPRLDSLTARELEVLALIARGMSNGEIAADLVLSEATVKTHVKRILSKLEVRDRVQAVVLAYEAGLVRPGGPL